MKYSPSNCWGRLTNSWLGILRSAVFIVYVIFSGTLICTFDTTNMAAKIEDTTEDVERKKNPRPVLKNKLEGCSGVVNMARMIPHEDAVITVSEDR